MSALSRVIIAVLAAGCSGGGGSSGDGPSIPMEDYPRLLADAICNNIGPCCLQADVPHDPAQCHANAEMGLKQEIEEVRTLPNRAYDPVAARACVDTVAAAARACTNEREVHAACKGVFAGTLKPGETCTDKNECVKGSACMLVGAGSTMQCFDPGVRGMLGQSCSESCTDFGDDVPSCSGGGAGGQSGERPVRCYSNDDLHCGKTNTCEAMAALGQVCISSFYCAGEAICDNSACTVKRTSGSCGQFNDACAATTYCDTTTRQCQPRKSTGAPCVSYEECPATDQCRKGTCRTRTIGSGDACAGGG